MSKIQLPQREYEILIERSARYTQLVDKLQNVVTWLVSEQEKVLIKGQLVSIPSRYLERFKQIVFFYFNHEKFYSLWHEKKEMEKELKSITSAVEVSDFKR